MPKSWMPITPDNQKGGYTLARNGNVFTVTRNSGGNQLDIQNQKPSESSPETPRQATSERKARKRTLTGQILKTTNESKPSQSTQKNSSNRHSSEQEFSKENVRNSSTPSSISRRSSAPPSSKRRQAAEAKQNGVPEQTVPGRKLQRGCTTRSVSKSTSSSPRSDLPHETVEPNSERTHVENQLNEQQKHTQSSSQDDSRCSNDVIPKGRETKGRSGQRGQRPSTRSLSRQAKKSTVGNFATEEDGEPLITPRRLPSDLLSTKKINPSDLFTPERAPEATTPATVMTDNGDAQEEEDDDNNDENDHGDDGQWDTDGHHWIGKRLRVSDDSKTADSTCTKWFPANGSSKALWKVVSSMRASVCQRIELRVLPGSQYRR